MISFFGVLDGVGWDGMGGNGWNDTTHTYTYAWICDDDDDLIPRMGKKDWTTYSLHIYARAGRMDGMVGVFSGMLHFTGTRWYQPTTWPDDDTT